MKAATLIFLLIVAIPISFASVLFDDYVTNGETFKAGDHYFSVQYIESQEKLNFRMDDLGSIISIGECESRDDVYYCFEDVDYPNIHVTIQSLEPKVTAEREFSTLSPR